MLNQIDLHYEELAEFCQRWAVDELALFGSILRPDFSAESDIDILVTFAPNSATTLFDLVAMQDELSSLLKRPVDLVSRLAVEKSPNHIRRQAILESAKVIYAK
jgi:predicted nucleotidyltransferase